MSYQDEWQGGRVIRRGYRECERRYEIVRHVCRSLRRDAFTVCDIGANLCYFGLRLTADFPGARVVAFESHKGAFARAQKLLSISGASRITLYHRRLHLRDIDAMARERGFDVVLALSVLHHVAGDPMSWLVALRKLGNLVVVEAAGNDSRRVAARALMMPADAIPLGQGVSHLDPTLPRSIFMLEGTAS